MTGSYEGRTFGRFRVVERVGAGGMGEVYRARDQHLLRDVAIKFLQPGEGLDRRLMRREAHALSRLNHPNIATVHDLLHEDGVDFVVMEFIEGESLEDRLADGPLDAETAVELARQIAAGLAEAHEHGIVHRDLKPGNVMITPRGQVKLVDFGLATLSTHLEESYTATDAGDLERRGPGARPEAGRVSGTLPYMSPEQIAGAEIDVRTDIWALGAVLYQMVTGTRPFVGANTLMVAEAILNRPPVAPSAIAPGVPPWLDELILCALEKSPARRFQAVAEVAELLAGRGEPGSAPSGAALGPPSSPSGRARGFASGTASSAPRSSPASLASAAAEPRRRRGWAVVALAVAVAAAAIGAWALLRGRAAAPATRLSVLVGDSLNRTGDATFDQVVTELLATSLEQSRFLVLYPRPRAAYVMQLMHKPPGTPIDQAAGLEICQREGLSALLTSSVTKLGTAYVLLLTLQDPSGRVLGTAKQEFAAAADLPARIDDAVFAIRKDLGESTRSIRGSSTPLAEVTSSSLEAVRFYTLGRQQLLASDTKNAIATFERALELDPRFATALAAIGAAYTNLQDYANAERYLARAAKLADSVPEAERHKILGDYNILRRNYDEACSHLEALTQLRPLDPGGFITLAFCDSSRFDNARALREIQRAIDMQPAFRPRVSRARFQFLGGDAAAALEGADALRKEVPQALHGHYVAAQAELALGRLTEARASYETMVALGGPAEAEGRVGLGDVDLATGRLDEAKSELERGWQSATRLANALTAAHAAAALAEVALAAHDAAGLETQLARLSGSGAVVVEYLRGRTLARAGRVEEASHGLAVDGEAPPADQSLAAMLRSEVALTRGDAAAAVREADAAWAFERSVVARETQARAYAAAGKRQQAAAFYADVLARANQRIDSYDAPGFHRVIEDEYRLGVLLDDLGDAAGARPHLEKVAATLAGPGEASEVYRDVRRRLAAAGTPTPTR